MTHEGRPDAESARYLADVVEHCDREGIAVERAVVDGGRGGRLVFDRSGPGDRGRPWFPVLAGWDPSRGWDVLLAGRGPATRRVALCPGTSEPAPDALVAMLWSLLAGDPDGTGAEGAGSTCGPVLAGAGQG